MILDVACEDNKNASQRMIPVNLFRCYAQINVIIVMCD